MHDSWLGLLHSTKNNVWTPTVKYNHIMYIIDWNWYERGDGITNSTWYVLMMKFLIIICICSIDSAQKKSVSNLLCCDKQWFMSVLSWIIMEDGKLQVAPIKLSRRIWSLKNTDRQLTACQNDKSLTILPFHYTAEDQRSLHDFHWLVSMGTIIPCYDSSDLLHVGRSPAIVHFLLGTPLNCLANWLSSKPYIPLIHSIPYRLNLGGG